MENKYYLKVWLKNVNDYFIKENLTLEEAQRLKDFHLRRGRNPKIKKHKRVR